MTSRSSQRPRRRFLRSIGIVFAATAISNGLLFAASLIAARWLEPEGYAVVATMLSVVVILTIPSYALQLVVARELTGADDERTALVLRSRTRQAAYFGIAAAAVACIFAAPLRNWLDLGSVWPIVLTALAAPLLLIFTVLRGVQQSRHQYGWVGVGLVVDGFARLAGTLAALGLGTGATGVTAAPLAGVALGALVSVIPLRDLPRPSRGSAHVQIPRSVWATGAFFAGFAVLTNTDLIIVKHAFASVSAGDYAAAAFVGKIVLLLPITVSIVLIPEVAGRVRRREPTVGLLWQALALTAAACGLVVVVSWLAPSLVATLTYGSGYSGAERLLVPYTIAMLMFALGNVQAVYGLTLGLTSPAWICVACAAAQGIAMWVWRDTAAPFLNTDDPQVGIVGIMITSAVVMWALCAAVTIRQANHRQPAGMIT